MISLQQCEDSCEKNDLCFTYTFKKNECSLKFRYKYDFSSISDPESISGYPNTGNFTSYFLNVSFSNLKFFKIQSWSLYKQNLSKRKF